MNWLNKLFGVEKPIIGMAHFKPLPGDPRYLPSTEVRQAADLLRRDIEALQEGGIDGIMLSNEGSLPWLLNPEPVTAVAMAALIGQVRNTIRVPFGVHVIWSPMVTLDLAAAVGSDFAWEVFTGVYASDFGLWNTNFGLTARHQRQIKAESVRLLFEVVPEAAVYLGDRSLKDQIRSTIFNAKPDALCIAGLKPGEAASLDGVIAAKELNSEIPVLVSTGVKSSNVAAQLAVADGAIVGSALKKDGNLWNAVDSNRVKDFMEIVREIRKE
jgi:membrane complex biogenesis BtpA family protein